MSEGEKRAAAHAERRRIELGLTKAKLARSAGVDAGTLGDFLNRLRYPREDSRSKIETALHVEVGTFDALASGDARALQLVAPASDLEPQSTTLRQATELQLAIELLERIRTRVESP